MPVRALLLFNPSATMAGARVREVISSALASELKLEVHPTKQRGHATHIAAGAVHEGFDPIFTFGGDGTANEVIQAIAGTSVRLGIIPGGSTNVLVRNLGLPNDPVAATADLLDKLRAGTTTTVGLGRANHRYFAANAGFGFDAAVVRHVERRYRLKRAARQLSFVWCGLMEWFAGYDRSRLPLTVELPGEAPRAGYAFAVVGNTNPYTYLGRRPLQATPDASFTRGLDLVATRTMRTMATFKILLQVLTTGGHVRSRATGYWRDLPEFTLRSDVPLPFQVDGDYAGEWREVVFASVPDALHLLA